MTLEPDGQATGCNPVQVGSTPTGVSDPDRRPDWQDDGTHGPDDKDKRPERPMAL